MTTTPIDPEPMLEWFTFKAGGAQPAPNRPNA